MYVLLIYNKYAYESPQIADAFRDLYKLLAKGLRRSPNYSELPKLANYIGATEEKLQ